MRKGIKYALVFTGGVAVGIGVCGANLVSYALSDEDIREGIKNKISRKIDNILYGDEPNSKRYSRNSYYSYKNDMSYSSSDVIFESGEKALKALCSMEDILDTYGVVTVADIYNIADIPCPFTSNKYGWTNLKNAEVIRVRMGYKINLPKPILLD